MQIRARHAKIKLRKALKTVIFFRHGKSDWKAPFSSDHQRPLAGRGRKAADLMGGFLTETGQIPDRVITSSALRARRTAERAWEAGHWDCPLRITDRLYGASSEAVLAEIQAQPDRASILLLTGHEPTWSQLTGRLSGAAAVRFPTAAMARIDFQVRGWKDVQFGRGELIWLVPPRVLRRALKIKNKN